MGPTDEQQKIIDCPRNIVVIANPGSGKTYTLSIKIKKILESLSSNKGIIAISYTNKASNELRQRSLSGGIDKKQSFFGTIDKFFISELIFPFLPRLFGTFAGELSIQSYKEILKDRPEEYQIALKIEKLKNKPNDSQISFMDRYYKSGIIFLELLGALGCYVYENVKSSRLYLKAKYEYIIIDEFQDSGYFQYVLFCYLVDLGITGIAVGDVDQAIFGFAQKSSEYLIALDKREDFNSLRITKNHRCHPSIVNYSKNFLSLSIFNPEEIRVYHINIQGTQVEIAKYIDAHIQNIKRTFSIVNNNDIAILVRGDATGKLINENMTTTHKYIINTVLDECSEIWATLFIEILFFIFDAKALLTDYMDKYFTEEDSDRDKVVKYLKKLKNTDKIKLIENIDIFLKIAKIIAPNNKSSIAINRLKSVLKNPISLSSYEPVANDEIQIITIHKSKGLEFKIVIHLDLYDYIIPSYSSIKNNSYDEDINLHYVAITRAKEACIFITSNKRLNSQNELKEGITSRFISREDLIPLRVNIT